MIVACGGCGKNYTFDLAKLAGRPSATLRCPACKTTITVSAADAGDSTTRLEVDADLIARSVKVPGGEPALPPSKRVSLAVLQGNDSGRIFPVERPRVVLGRGDADIVLNDSEVSRQHAAIEIHGARVVLKDLGSTNGTFMDDVKIAQAEIDNRAEFRVGGTKIMLILTDVELEPLA